MLNNISNKQQTISSSARYQLVEIDRQNETQITNSFKQTPIICKFIALVCILCIALARKQN